MSAITVAEITAGTIAHTGLPEPISFSATDNQVDVSVLQRQDLSEPGTLSFNEIAIEPRRNAAGNALVAAITPDNDYWLVKFEGGNIAAGDQGAIAAADVYDAVKVVAGARSDVDTPRGEARGTRIVFQIAATITWGGIVAA